MRCHHRAASDDVVGKPVLPKESRFGPKRGFGVTPGGLLTISKPNPYPKSEKPPSAERVHKTESLKSPR